jgi:hypothetical protein
VLVAHSCNPSYSGGRDQEDRGSRRPYLKNTIHKKGWWSGSSVKHLPSKCEVLCSNPSTEKKREKEHFSNNNKET